MVCAAALAVAGCKNSAQVFTDQNDGGFFAKPVDFFKKPDWAKPANANTAELGPTRQVGPEDLVAADGTCSGAGAQPALAPAAAPEGAIAVTPAEPGAPTVLGGIALAMTECQVVQRAGTPTNVSIGAGEKGERNVVLTYPSGTWPGIYRFSDGRLKVIERAQAPPEPPKPPAKKKKAAPKKKTAPAQ